MQLSDFDYHLPDNLIAKYPSKRRRDSRLLVLDCAQGEIIESQFSCLSQFLRPHDLMIFNNTKVMKARLFGKKSTGGKVEILIERMINKYHVIAHIRANKSPKIGTLILLEGDCKAEVINSENGMYELHFSFEVNGFIDKYGALPIPPYLSRSAGVIDEERYQTVYAKERGAVAAPTAGLHFDDCMLKELKENKIDSSHITLHVGAGTFQSLRQEDVNKNSLHSEFAKLDKQVCLAIENAKSQNGRVIPVGTTSMRTIETASSNIGIKPWCGETNIFIKPGYNFKIADGLLTNFHLPRSSLLMLVAAMAGKELIFEANQYAIEHKFRFFSYGDAMLILPKGL